MSVNIALAGRFFLLLLSLVNFSGVGLQAASSPANDYDTDARKPYIEEAAQAVVGRMFGVEGDISNIKYHEWELTAHSPRNAAVRSLFVPGWGQYFNRQRVKGSVLFLTTLGATMASFSLYNKSRHTYEDYKVQGSKDSSAYEDYKDQRTHSFLLGAAVAVLWSATVVDAHKNAYTTLYSKSPSLELVLTDESAGLVVKKNF